MLKSQGEEMATKNEEFAKNFKDEMLKSHDDAVSLYSNKVTLLGEQLLKANEMIVILNNANALLYAKLTATEDLATKAIKKTEQQEQTIKTLEKELESLKIHVRSKNLIIHGVPEETGETRPALKKKISELLSTHCGKPDISFDIPTRIGLTQKRKNSSRPVKMSFDRQSDRDSILFRKVYDCPIDVRADLPPETAAKRHILGRLTRWAKSNNIKQIRRTDFYVELDGTRFNHEEAKDFLDTADDNRPYPGDCTEELSMK